MVEGWLLMSKNQQDLHYVHDGGLGPVSMTGVEIGHPAKQLAGWLNSKCRSAVLRTSWHPAGWRSLDFAPSWM